MTKANSFSLPNIEKRRLDEFILGCNLDRLSEKIVVAPCWMPDSININIVEKLSRQRIDRGVWLCEMDGAVFTYIVSGVGAGTCADTVLSLSDTKCKEILLIGSAGSLNSQIQVGDLFFPNAIVSGDGTCRYISDNVISDYFCKEIFPSKSIQNAVINAAAVSNMSIGESVVNWHIGKTVTVDSFYSEFCNLPLFLQLKCESIEMEAAAFLMAAQKIGIRAGAVFCISDNIMNGEPLYSVLKERTLFRKEVRQVVMPDIISAFLFDC